MVKARHDNSLNLTGGIKQGEKIDERCIVEVESTGHANMGLRGKEESVMSPRFFYMSNWIDGDAISGMGKTKDGRGLKGY